MYPIRVRSSALIVKDKAVLLIEFTDENGPHYNLPGGGVEAGETLIEAVIREAREEAAVEIEVGEVAFLYEYAPHLTEEKYGPVHSYTTIFECRLKEGEVPQMPSVPDKNQTAVKWVQLDDLHTIILYPNIREHIIEYTHYKQTIHLLEEQSLMPY